MVLIYEPQSKDYGLTSKFCAKKEFPFVKIATYKHGMHRVDRSNLDGIIATEKDEECLSSQIFNKLGMALHKNQKIFLSIKIKKWANID